MPKRRAGEHLTVFEQKFVNEYLIDPNGIRAYRRAIKNKVSYATARSEASKLLTRPNVRDEITAAMKAVSHYAKVKAAKVVKGLTKIALVDPLDLFDRETGNMLPLEKVPPRARLAIQKIKCKVVSKKLESFTDENGDQQVAEVTTETIEVAFNDRNSALDKLAKHLGLYLKDNEQKHGIKSEAEAEAIKDKLRQRGFNFEALNMPSGN